VKTRCPGTDIRLLLTEDKKNRRPRTLSRGIGRDHFKDAPYPKTELVSGLSENGHFLIFMSARPSPTGGAKLLSDSNS
jgi:hypothetical protein